MNKSLALIVAMALSSVASVAAAQVETATDLPGDFRTR
jgi:hypothetical protein